MLVILWVNACMQNEGDLWCLHPMLVIMVNLLNMCIVCHMFMHQELSDIYIQWGDRILCIQNVGDYDVLLPFWGDDLVGDWYDMHVGVGLGALH